MHQPEHQSFADLPTANVRAVIVATQAAVRMATDDELCVVDLEGWPRSKTTRIDEIADFVAEQIARAAVIGETWSITDDELVRATIAPRRNALGNAMGAALHAAQGDAAAAVVFFREVEAGTQNFTGGMWDFIRDLAAALDRSARLEIADVASIFDRHFAEQKGKRS